NIGVADAQAGQNIELHQDSPTGQLLGTLTVQSTGSFSTFTQQSFTTNVVASGIHDIYLVVLGNGFGAGNLNWIKFSSPADAGLIDRSNWTATASSTYDSFPVTNAYDNDITSRWGSGQNEANGMYFQVDLQNVTTFNKIVVNSSYHSGDSMQDYQVLVSTDGTNFSAPVASGTGSAVTSITFSAQSARYIRIVLTSGAGHWWSIDELYVYNAA
ncbi:MAG TPA: discoidin domain-containing protein, partial [Ktedonobacteraceae bacterium]|nr:discoidin domain-containing protein [Ktedonobacteraceae bacterium]